MSAAACRRCGRAIVGPAEIAAAAERVRALVAGAVSLAQAGSSMEDAYGGPREVRRALEKQLLTAEGLALDLSHAAADTAACSAGTCLLLVPAPRGLPRSKREPGGGVHDGRQR